jgi:hypothetical protein
MSDTQVNQIQLPDRLISSVDLSRTLRELKALDDSLHQAELRKPGEPTQLARSSATLEELAQINNIALTDKAQREQLIAIMQAFYEHAPRVHMSVAVEPSARFTQQVTIWMRKNINPVLLIEVGLQPTLAAGCMLRTSNKIFDMSLRHRFIESRHILFEKLGVDSEPVLQPELATVSQAVAQPAPEPVAAVAQQAQPSVQPSAGGHYGQ